MSLFDENAPVPAPRRRMSRASLAGLWAVSFSLVALLILTIVPTSFVIQRPGPVYDTLGSVASGDGEQRPLISISGAETFPTSGTLDLLTVEVLGNRERTPSWLELAAAWFDPARAVVPIDEIFPEGVTTEQRNDENAALMVDSQKEATAAALSELGYDVTSLVRVHQLADDSPAAGILEPDDVIRSVDGQPVTTTAGLRDAVNTAGGRALMLEVDRSGQQRSVEVTPKQMTTDGETRWVIGVTIAQDFDFPIDVTLQLDNVGGPSAGMMFALGIIDTLTPGELTGGERFAGTGTIDATGNVGPIGGIRQKLYGAKDAGAAWFLAPERNCNEVVGHIPDGLRVFSVADLDDALSVVETVSEGGDLDALPTCTAG
ncbi:ATP-dependent serine peptidase containing a PDZ domain protein [Microbacterium sp. AISO3]|uniref:YlbL family protein n=1 Tax=Microbacterium sp. AISO3 TaxID=2002831 RepID=UPI000B4CE29E|nr:S16 family serine protease [Microbacterium sp. AISO3]OWP22995.1 ATP-dependent serine peptidase containing a PDZ domain protein [Microbacterium sp. AISO3]